MSARQSLERGWDAEVRRLETEQLGCRHRVEALARRYSGLKSLDDVFAYLRVTFRLVLVLLDGQSSARREERQEIGERARRHVVDGTLLLEELVRQNISLDQSDAITGAPEYTEIRRLFGQVLARSGEIPAFRAGGRRKRKAVQRTVAQAIRKFADPDDRQTRFLRIENLPKRLREVLEALFSGLVPREGEDGPAGLEEGEEQVRSSRRMVMPVSQAILFYEDEVIPEYERRLRENPGDRELGRRIARARRLVEDYRNIHISPRARPTLFQDSAGFWDAIITGFTQEGELLVRVDLPVMYASGNNTDRVQEQVKAEIVRRCARHGFDDGLDSEAKRLLSPESGTAGNSRDPLSRMDAMRAYDLLKLRFPLLRRIEEPGVMKALLEDARGGGDSRLRERIAELEADERRLLELHRPPESTYDEP